MKLSHWLTERDMSLAEFAALIEVKVQSAHRYARGERFPRPAIMQRIKAVTLGTVAEADFYADGVGSEAA
jgi:transcriptional regulator with XRE-family HTH domain